MDINDIVASRFYSWVYQPDADSVAKGMNKGGRAGVAPNPLYGRVTCRKVYAGQAASGQMYVNAAKRLNPAWQAAKDYTPRFEDTENPCVLRSLSTGEYAVRIINPRTVKVEWFVDGQPATEEQLALIAQYKRQRTPDPKAVKIMFPYVPNLVNVTGELDEVDEED